MNATHLYLYGILVKELFSTARAMDFDPYLGFHHQPGYGQPVHCSVFRCDLTRLGRVEMASVLIDLIDEEEDRIMIIDMGPVDGRVAERIEFLGVHPEENGREEKVIIE